MKAISRLERAPSIPATKARPRHASAGGGAAKRAMIFDRGSLDAVKPKNDFSRSCIALGPSMKNI